MSEHGKAKGKKSTSSLKTWMLRIFLSVFLVGVIVVSVAVIGFTSAIVKARKDDDILLDLDNLELKLTTIIYAVDGDSGKKTELKRLYADENRVWVDIDKIPDHVKDAFVAIEDKRFYEHKGVDWRRTGSAVINLVRRSEDSHGGSTITQQLIKNITGQNQVAVSRKAIEILRALDVEKKYDKDTILEAYLNTINLGGMNQGVQAAARYYFNKDVSKLSIAEAASIASITKSPKFYNPNEYPENNKERREQVLYDMLKQGRITQEEHDKALKEELKFNKSAIKEPLSLNNWFVDQVIHEIVEDLQSQKGMSSEQAYNYLYTGGLRIEATVDKKVQAVMEDYYKSAKKNETFDSESCMIILGQKGEIKGVIGGMTKTTNLELNRATRVPRQIGSTMKPLGAFAPAIDKGIISPGTVMTDEAIYGVKNFSGGYSGKVTMQKALNESLNTIPVKIVEQMLGATESFNYLKDRFKISTLVAPDPNDPDASNDLGWSALALGGLTEGITPMELAAAYNVFATGGWYYKPHSYTTVTQALTDEIVLENTQKGEQVMDADVAAIMNNMLQGVAKNTSGVYVRGQANAGKTGTTNMGIEGYKDYVKDLWFVGYTPYYTGVIWEGYDSNYKKASDGEKVVQHLGYKNTQVVRGALSYVMSEIHEDLSWKDFAVVKDMINQTICQQTGLLAGQYCESTTLAYFRPDGIPGACPGHPDVKKKREEEAAKKEAEKEKEREKEKEKENANKPQTPPAGEAGEGEGGTTTPPSGGGAGGGGTTTPPSGGGTGGGGTTTPPSGGGTGGGGTTTPPSGGGTGGGTTKPPTSGGTGTTRPPAGGGTSRPPVRSESGQMVVAAVGWLRQSIF